MQLHTELKLYERYEPQTIATAKHSTDQALTPNRLLLIPHDTRYKISGRTSQTKQLSVLLPQEKGLTSQKDFYRCEHSLHLADTLAKQLHESVYLSQHRHYAQLEMGTECGELPVLYLFLATRFIVYTFLWFIVSMNYTFVCLRVLPGTPIYTDTHTRIQTFFYCFHLLFRVPEPTNECSWAQEQQ